MSQRMQQGQAGMIMSDNAQRVKDRDAQEYNISAARAVAEAVRSTLGPKGMDKMLVDSMGSVTVTNDGVTILQEMDINNPAAEMIVEVAETQEEEAGDGTTTAVAMAGELLKNAEDLLEQGIHPTAIIKGFHLASEFARGEIDEIATPVDPDDDDLLRAVAETSMTGRGPELNKELLASLIVDAVRRISVDGKTDVDLKRLNIETNTGSPADRSHLLEGGVVSKDPDHESMPVDVEDADVLLLSQYIEVDETDVDAEVNVSDPTKLQQFLDREEGQLEEKVDRIAALGADVLLCQKEIDNLAQHYLAKRGILSISQLRKADVEFLSEVLDATIVTDLKDATSDELGHGDVVYDDDDDVFRVTGDDGHAVTLMLYGSTEHVADELERGVNDALDVVAQTTSNGRVLAGGGAIEVELASRLRDYADSVSGREQLAVEAFADALELIPRVLAENSGHNRIDTLVDLRAAHDDGEYLAGFNVYTGDVENTFDAGVVESAHAKQQAITSATEAGNLVLKIDDIISAGDITTEDKEDDGPGGIDGMM